MSDLIERLRQLASNTGKMTWVNDLPTPATAVLHLAADEIEALIAQLARARQEGWNAAIEAAAGEAIKGRNYWRDKCDATKVKRESRDYETMAIACVHIEHAIRALASDAKGEG